MDEFLRRLERLAAAGDPEAAQKLLRWKNRIEGPKYFCYSQNNIMGIMINRPKEGIGSYVVIEDYNEEDANDRLQAMLGDSYYGYCECCGRRWGNVHIIFDNPDDLGSWWKEVSIFKDSCYVHLLDGTIAPC